MGQWPCSAESPGTASQSGAGKMSGTHAETSRVMSTRMRAIAIVTALLS